MCFYFTTKVQIASAIIANCSQLSTNVPSQPLVNYLALHYATTRH